MAASSLKQGISTATEGPARLAIGGGRTASPLNHPAVERGIGWLVDQQRADGGWDEDAFTGTGFPLDFMIKYHYYRLYFPVTALGRYANRHTA